MLRALVSFAVGLIGGYLATRAWWGAGLTEH
jgi:hypothetical protein